jgi:hypothetical protein
MMQYFQFSACCKPFVNSHSFGKLILTVVLRGNGFSELFAQLFLVISISVEIPHLSIFDIRHFNLLISVVLNFLSNSFKIWLCYEV